ncbi:MAG: TatD family hydrolase [Clostridia bacterium]|nr:TatD family hydrolase [Clostridia bacterium]
MEFFDSHSHYNDEKFDDDREYIIEETYKNDITKFMCIGYNVKQSKKAIEIAKKYSYIYATAGISPNDIEENVLNDIYIIEEIAKDDKVKAIGEIGLDYYWNKDNKEIQKEVFVKQIDLANKLELPIVIHNRDAYVDTIKILKEHQVYKKGIFHCCQLNQELIKDALKLGFYISFSGIITFKNAKAEEAVSLVPMNRLLIETDSPYLTPEPHRGTRNTSINVKYVADKIANIKCVSLEEVAKTTYENAMRIYNI